MKRILKTAKVIAVGVFAVLCGSAAYAGGLEGERVASGVRFGEAAVLGEASAVKMSGDFAPVEKAALTADLKKEVPRIAVPPVPKSNDKNMEDVGDTALEGAGVGANIGAFVGVLAGMVGGVILTIGVSAAIGGPLGIALGIIIVLLGGIVLGGSIGAIAGMGVGAAIGAGIGAIAGMFKNK